MTMSIRRISMALIGSLGASMAFAQQDAAPPAKPPLDTVTVEYTKLPPLIMTHPPRPKYPKAAKGISGWVRVECMVNHRGRIDSVRVVASEPAGLFDEAAIEAMKSVRFEPWKSPDPRLMTQRLIFSPTQGK